MDKKGSHSYMASVIDKQINNKISKQFTNFSNHQLMARQTLFFLNPNSSQLSSQSTAYIFDDIYKTKLQKHRFQHDPKFAYFNAVKKMKNKLSSSQHEVYDMIFDHQFTIKAQEKDPELHNFHQDRINTVRRLRNNSVKEKVHPKELNETNTKSNTEFRSSVKQISFQQNSSIHTKRQSAIYYDTRPRLDNILAQYRKMNKKQKQKQRRKSFYLGSNKKDIDLQLLNKTTKLFSRQFSQPQRDKKNVKL